MTEEDLTDTISYETVFEVFISNKECTGRYQILDIPNCHSNSQEDTKVTSGYATEGPVSKSDAHP